MCQKSEVKLLLELRLHKGQMKMDSARNEADNEVITVLGEEERRYTVWSLDIGLGL